MAQRGDQFLDMLQSAADREGWSEEAELLVYAAQEMDGWSAADPMPGWWVEMADKLSQVDKPRAARFAALARQAAGRAQAHKVGTGEIVRGTLEGSLETAAKVSERAGQTADATAQGLSDRRVQWGILGLGLLFGIGYAVNAVKR